VSLHPSLVYQPPMTRTAALAMLNRGRTPTSRRNVAAALVGQPISRVRATSAALPTRIVAIADDDGVHVDSTARVRDLTDEGGGMRLRDLVGGGS